MNRIDFNEELVKFSGFLKQNIAFQRELIRNPKAGFILYEKQRDEFSPKLLLERDPKRGLVFSSGTNWRILLQDEEGFMIHRAIPLDESSKSKVIKAESHLLFSIWMVMDIWDLGIPKLGRPEKEEKERFGDGLAEIERKNKIKAGDYAVQELKESDKERERELRQGLADGKIAFVGGRKEE